MDYRVPRTDARVRGRGGVDTRWRRPSLRMASTTIKGGLPTFAADCINGRFAENHNHQDRLRACRTLDRLDPAQGESGRGVIRINNAKCMDHLGSVRFAFLRRSRGNRNLVQRG
jgi:hypothetical protein